MKVVISVSGTHRPPPYFEDLDDVRIVPNLGIGLWRRTGFVGDTHFVCQVIILLVLFRDDTHGPLAHFVVGKVVGIAECIDDRLCVC
jgi:hypothetical protein